MEYQEGNLSKGKKLTIVFSILGGVIILGGLITFFVLSIAVNKIDGNIQMDGAQFVAQKCNSGNVFSFSGVQLTDASGRRIRVISDPVSGATKVAFFNSLSQTVGEDLGPCAKITMQPQISTVNGIKNQRGTATFSCTSGVRKITGTVTFSNCH